MSFFFFLHNLHFALEIVGLIAFGMVAWLAYDAFLLRRDFLTASRGVGFLLLTFWQGVHAFTPSGLLWGYAGLFAYLLGLFLIAVNLMLEKPAPRPEFKAIVVVPPLTFAAVVAEGAAAFFFALIAWLAHRQYRLELKKTLKPFWFAFLFFAAASVFAALEGEGSIGVSWMWIAGHLMKLAGFASVIWWVWQYLQLRIREELMVIFIAMALFLSVAVTLAFSVILNNQVVAEIKQNLLTNARILDFSISRLREEASAKARVLAGRQDIRDSLLKNDFVRMELLLSGALEKEQVGFLSVIDRNGDVVMRAHALASRGDTLRDDRAVFEALGGKEFVTIALRSPENFSIRAAAPVMERGKVVGVILAGFPLDNAFADNIQRLTGLEMSLFEGDARVATTIRGSDGHSRFIGIRETDADVRDAVLARGEGLVKETFILSRPYLASFLPLRDADGVIVGMASSAAPERDIAALVSTTNRLTLISVMALLLMLMVPLYLLTKRLSLEI